MQTVAKAAGPRIQLVPQLWKQLAELPRFIRQIRSIEPWCVSHATSFGQREQFHMSGGVTPPLQTS